jgi:subtilisin family serine protease
VEYAVPDHRVHAAGTVPNDPKFADGTLWGLNNTGQNGGKSNADIDAPEAWDALTSASNLVVAVIDTGVRYAHEDLADNMWISPWDRSHGLNVLTGSNDPNDDSGHGTQLAGIIGAAGDNAKGIVGVAWRVRIMACKFLDRFGDGSISDAITCIDFARTNGAHIINASWGTTEFSPPLSNAVYAARAEGIIVVAAAGNDGKNIDLAPFYPASFDLDNLVVVAATTRTDALVSFSNLGATNVDLAAPGQEIYSTDSESDSAYATDEGTSMSAAYVSGALALVRTRYPSESYQRTIARVLTGTDRVPNLQGVCATGGRLNVRKALEPRTWATTLAVVRPVNADSFRLLVTGEPGRQYVIQTATNLADTGWMPAATNVTGQSGTFVFTYDQPVDETPRYFRAVSAW